MATRIRSAALSGIDGLDISVEVDISRGLPGFHLVGLPGAAVRESRQRVLAALRHSGIKVPPGHITVNLAPADLPKAGSSFDLAIALGVVAAAGRHGAGALRERRQGTVYLGELSLFGELRPVRGLLAMVLAAGARGADTVVVPQAQLAEAALVDSVVALGADNLAGVLAWLRGDGSGVVGESGGSSAAAPHPGARQASALDRIAGLDGQHLVRKAAMVASVGRHNLLLVGPPGTGKTRLARALGDLQVPPSRSEALEVTRIHGAVGEAAGLVAVRPFRAPHHTATRAGLVGGGSALRPGEITLAHLGMLFLDEFAEFPPAVLDALREPVEEGQVVVSRGPGRRVYPARFQLVAAMNPCRCGYLGSQVRPCRCQPGDRQRYLARLSGPLLDRFDLCAEVGAWVGRGPGLTDDDPVAACGLRNWRERPTAGDLARARAALAPEAADRPRWPDATAARLDDARRALGLSLRAVSSCRRVARTIAALDGSPTVAPPHVVEALEMRQERVLPGGGPAGGE